MFRVLLFEYALCLTRPQVTLETDSIFNSACHPNTSSNNLNRVKTSQNARMFLINSSTATNQTEMTPRWSEFVKTKRFYVKLFGSNNVRGDFAACPADAYTSSISAFLTQKLIFRPTRPFWTHARCQDRKSAFGSSWVIARNCFLGACVNIGIKSVTFCVIARFAAC